MKRKTMKNKEKKPNTKNAKPQFWARHGLHEKRIERLLAGEYGQSLATEALESLRLAIWNKDALQYLDLKTLNEIAQRLRGKAMLQARKTKSLRMRGAGTKIVAEFLDYELAHETQQFRETYRLYRQIQRHIGTAQTHYIRLLKNPANDRD